MLLSNEKKSIALLENAIVWLKTRDKNKKRLAMRSINFAVRELYELDTTNKELKCI